MGLTVIRFWFEFIAQTDRSGFNLWWLEKAFL
jgi:hypothetical protein